MASTDDTRPERRPARGARRLTTTVATVAAVAALATACSSGGSGSSATSTSSTSSTSTSTTRPDPGPGPTTLDGVSIGLDTIVGPRPAETTRTTAPNPLTGEVTYLDAPTAMASRAGHDQIWIAERGGTVRILTVNTEYDKGLGRSKRTGYTLLPGNALDISALTTTDGERGLLGLTFSTDGRTLYVDHTAQNGDIVVAAYTVVDKSAYSGGAEGPPPKADQVSVVDPATRRELLTIPHQGASNHNGGQITLGPDGYLYVGVGDGGGAGDPNGNAQNTESLLGKILRIDPAAVVPFQSNYVIPADNPFAGGGGRPEIYLYGVRNPWRFSFDRQQGDLWVADVGQNTIEEVDWLPAAYGAGRGANLGWNWFEGNQRFRTDGTPPEGLVAPILTYDHSQGRCSITGGYVYRGTAVPALQGVYVYGDYCTGEIRGLLARNGVALADASLGPSAAQNTLVSFGQDDDGELYVLAADGTLSKVVAP